MPSHPRKPRVEGDGPASKAEPKSAALPARKASGASETAVGLGCAAGVVALFSSFVLVSRYGLQTALEPADLAFLRFVVAGLVLMPVFLRHGTAGLTLPQAAALAGLGAIGFALFAYSGFERAPASHGSALIHGALPAFSLAFAYGLCRHRPGRLSLAGAVAIGGGVLLMIWDSIALADGDQLLGDLFLLCASACWAGYGLLVRRLGVPALPAAAIVTTLAMIGYAPAYLAATSTRVLSLPVADALTQAAFQGFLIGVLSIVLYTRAVQALGANAAALAAALVPALTTVLAVPLLGETPSATTLSGVLLVTLGIVGPIVVRRSIS
ncbi:MAG: DMT family transporter [Hyphomicrobiaceae bacterium]|nr:DMT family transporter [Hyphomicrobiaceae bacterium]